MAARRATVRGAFAAAVVVLVLAAVSLARAHGVADEQVRLADQLRRNERAEAALKELAAVRELEVQLDAARSRVRSVAAATTVDVAWARLLEDLGRATPGDVWLTAMQAERGAAGGTLRFTAAGVDFPSLTRWIDQISLIPYLSDVTIGSATRAAMGAASVIDFESSAAFGADASSDRLHRLTEEG